MGYLMASLEFEEMKGEKEVVGNVQEEVELVSWVVVAILLEQNLERVELLVENQMETGREGLNYWVAQVQVVEVNPQVDLMVMVMVVKQGVV